MKKHIKRLILLGIIITGGIVCINKIIDLLSDRNDDLPIGKGKYYNWKYGDIYYTKTGKGKPILLIHDLTVSSSSYEWNKVIQKLSETNTVYALDLLGCGRSDKPNLTYTNYLYVQLISEFIKKEIGQKTDIIATGDSFSFTLMSSQIDGELIGKIVCVSPCDVYDMAKTPDTYNKLLKKVIETPIFGTFIYNIVTCRPKVTSKIVNESFYDGAEVTDDIVKAYYKAAKNYDGNGKYLLASIGSYYTNINIIPALKRAENDILLIGGKNHPYIHEIIHEYAEIKGNVVATYIDHTDYLPQLEKPDEFVETIRKFL